MWCSIYQWLISTALDGDKPLGRVTTRHVRHCRRCGQFWRASEAVDRRLRIDSCAAPPASQSISRSVLPLPRLVGRALLGASALAAIILLAVALRPPDVDPAPLGVPTDFVSAQAVQVFVTAPAEAEMNHLAQDAQDAAKVLLSYLPTNADQITGQQ